MSVREIALLGNPILRTRCQKVRNAQDPAIHQVIRDLKDTLMDFKGRRGFGRGIAAPQIGETLQIIYIDYEYTGAMINPVIKSRSRRRFMLWDDCFSFPDLLVKVERNLSIVVSFADEAGKTQTLKAEGGMSELLQHEIDHVNGILAIDRAIDSKHIVLRQEFEKLAEKSPAIL